MGLATGPFFTLTFDYYSMGHELLEYNITFKCDCQFKELHTHKYNIEIGVTLTTVPMAW